MESRVMLTRLKLRAFLSGMASIADFWGQLDDSLWTRSSERDVRTAHDHWRMVGCHLASALRKHERRDGQDESRRTNAG